MSGARYWERIDEAAPRPTYVSMALPTFPYKDLWGGSQSKKPVLPINSFCCPPLTLAGQNTIKHRSSSHAKPVWTLTAEVPLL